MKERSCPGVAKYIFLELPTRQRACILPTMEIIRLFPTYEIRFADIRRLLLSVRKGMGKLRTSGSVSVNKMDQLFGAPRIPLQVGDSRFIGSEFTRFRNGENATSHTSIRGDPRSLGATSRVCMYFNEMLQQIKDNRKNRKIRPVDWKEQDSLRMVRLNTQVRKYDGLTPVRRVSGRTPKNADRVCRQSVFWIYESSGFHMRADISWSCETAMRKKPSLGSDRIWEFSRALNRRAQYLGVEEFCLRADCVLLSEMGKQSGF